MSRCLWIAGIQVTDDNKNNITGPGISAEHFPDGKVWYNSDDNILTLENVHIVNSNPTGWVEGIFSMIENLTIVVKGSHNLVESRYNHAILSYSSLTFGDGEQDGILKVVGKLHGIAVWNEKNYLTINNGVRLEVESTESSALYANYAKSGIYIESGTTMLMATSKESNAISGFGFVSYYGSIELCKPQGKSYDKTNRVLGDPKETVVYGRRINITNTKFPDDKLYEEIQKFNTDGNGYLDRDEIYEAQTLSRMNIANYTGISYLWDLRKILVNYTLDDSNYYNLDVKSNPFLEMIYSAQGGHLFSIDNLWACPWLEEVGLYKNHLNLIDVSQNTRLKILKVEDNSIWHVYPPTRLEECLPFASYYIYDNEISSNFMDELIASLPVNNTNKEYRIYVKSEYGDKEQNVCTDQQMNAILEKGWIPAVRTNVNEYKDHSYTYDLTIGGNIKVTDANAHDIMGDGGGMSYDPTTKTLSLMNDYEFSTNGIESHINGLTIKVADNSTLDCQSDAIDLYANTTITGNHQLAVKSKIGVGIFVDDGKTLTIDNATLEMSAQMPCILGATTTGSQKLNIKDSNIEAHSSSSSVAISGFPAGITFEGCNITEPDTQFDKIEESHFQRLYENADSSIKETFNLQYRMHPDINEVIKQFYLKDGGLDCGLIKPKDLGVNEPDFSNPASRYHGIDMRPFIGHNTHVLFINTDSPEMLDGTSRVNYGEVEVIGKLLDRFASSSTFSRYLDKFDKEEDKQIGIISFYGKQIKQIRALAKLHKDIPIRVSTVDRFQGMERNIIIVSMVRSHVIQAHKDDAPNYARFRKYGYPEQYSLGFAQSPNRLNVALSRAKRLLVIVGNEKHFSQHPIYEQLFKTIRNNPNNKVIEQSEL